MNNAVNVDHPIMHISQVTSDVLKDVRGDIRSRRVVELANVNRAMRPDRFKKGGPPRPTVLAAHDGHGLRVRRPVAEEARVIVRTEQLLPVLAAHEEADPARRPPKPLHEQLEVAIPQRTTRWQVFVRVGERDERVLLMQLRFVNAAKRPGSGPGDTATRTTTARDFELAGARNAVGEGKGATWGQKGRHGPKTGHSGDSKDATRLALDRSPRSRP